jgi:hypothetical protein
VGMASPRELVEQRRDAIPGCAKVAASSCGVRALNAHTRGQERGQRACRGLRARRTPLRGVEPSSEADLARGVGLSP